MSGRIDFTMGFNTQRAAHKRDGDNGYRVYILGNFSGHSDFSWEQRKIRAIDIDNFDQVMTQIMPALKISSDLTLQIATLKDFHPDTWLEKVQILVDLQKLKAELNNPNTAAQAATKIQARYQSQTTNETPAQTQQITENQNDTLQRLLGKKPEHTIDETDSVDHFINQLVSPYITKTIEPHYQTLINIIDSTMSQFLRTLLHGQDFQHLEALWRATEALVNEESDNEQCYFLVDISSAELLTELQKGNNTFTQKLLQHSQSSDNEQEILLIGDYCFSDSADDRDLLRYCSQLAKTCGGYFIGAADISLIEHSIFGEANNSQHWTEFLNKISADRVILTYPRYLLRLPYGNKRDPIEAFEFEEYVGTPQSNELLWGNSAFICVRVLIRTSGEYKNEDQFYFNDIPAFTFNQDGESVLQPATEILLNETQVNALLSKGITPLVGFRQRQGICLMTISALSQYS